MTDPFPILHDPPNADSRFAWYHHVPVIGWMAGYSKQLQTEHSLVQQAITRGNVPEAAWAPYSYDQDIRKTIEDIVIANAYPKGSTFHPLDPVELMFVLRYGDLNELEIVMDLEKQLGFHLGNELISRLIDERTTFIDFIRMVESA